MKDLQELKCPIHATEFKVVGRKDNVVKEEVYLYYIAECGCKYGCVLTTLSIAKGEFNLEEIKKILDFTGLRDGVSAKQLAQGIECQPTKLLF